MLSWTFSLSPIGDSPGFAPSEKDVERFLAERQSFVSTLRASAQNLSTEEPFVTLIDLLVVHDNPLLLKIDLSTATPARITVHSRNFKDLDMVCAPFVTVEDVISAFLNSRLIEELTRVLVMRDVPHATALIGSKTLGELGIVTGEALMLHIA